MDKQISNKPLSNMEVSSFCSQMAMILHSGISSLEGITIMLGDATEEGEKSILRKILDTLETTGNFHESLKESGVFPAYLLHMTAIGEQTGKLDEVMDALSAHYDREDSISRAIKNAVTYPLIMISMMVLVILVLLVKVMPIFNQVFLQLGSEMTGFSRGLLAIGTSIGRYSFAFVALLVLIIACFVYFTKTDRGRMTLQKLGYRFRFSRTLYEGMAACRFASGMALTLSSGMNPEECLSLVSELIENPSFRKRLDKCREESEAGQGLSDALLENHIFSGMYARMVSIGSKTGALDEVMDKIAGQYEEDIDTKINNLLAVLEPTLVILLSVVVGVILLSVMLPLMGIMSSL